MDVLGNIDIVMGIAARAHFCSLSNLVKSL